MQDSWRTPSHQYPGSQGAQLRPPSLRVMLPCTAGQGLHTAADVATSACEKVPGSAATHSAQLASAAAPSALEKRPAPQGLQDAPPPPF